MSGFNNFQSTRYDFYVPKAGTNWCESVKKKNGVPWNDTGRVKWTEFADRSAAGEAVVLASKQTGQCGNRTAAIRRVVVKTFEKARAHTYIIAYRNYMRSHLRGPRVRKNVNSEIMVWRGRQRERYLPFRADVRAAQHAFSISIIRTAGGNRAFRFRPT